ncbi:hypothetical protein [Actomonas aquatica]|uniref:HEPN domain-containing protein n=1 Tax=Actomonas aquatica TaxID=2866162 RepID=A0ABZ1CB77_9BACT|nr:hypothetical protein [Opitutus sp. WL0086]WRQ88843.1 hypothetical protein K1X11_005460 [Opitutus sp. WL0086]WRQ88849.1 hypothetical protein K1X11_005490 [Opitutus sp. WL0086]
MPYSPNSLFRKGVNWQMNACIGTNGGPHDYRAYADGFFDAAEHLIESIRSRREPRLHIDTAIYPIVQSYRHGLELSLKHLLIESTLVLRSNPELPMIHDLGELWRDLKTRISELPAPVVEADDVLKLEQAISDFSCIDPIGMVFRYPEDRKRQLHIQTSELLNLEVLEEGMKSVRQITENMRSSISYLITLSHEEDRA